MSSATADRQTIIPSVDVDTLRRLAGELSQAAGLKVHCEKARMWGKLNQLQSVRPMVWINELPWHELNINDELTLQCRSEWGRAMEQSLRRTLYQWRHFPADMILSDYLPCELKVHSTGFGISEDVDVVRTDASSTVVSREFHPQIVDEKDIEKIKDPVVRYDADGTAYDLDLMRRVFGGIMPVRMEGIKSIWFTPWDNLIRWWGVEQAMMDLVLRPEMVHAAVSRCVDVCMAELDQYEHLNVLTLGNDNTRIGSGGYGYTDELPGQPFDAEHVRPANLWGCSNAQIFSSVSPEMHREFALKHDMRWLKRWGLTYYGCCEPLDIKMGILRQIPNLRKVSMSPWINAERAARKVGRDYVFSYKPNPAFLAEDTWRPAVARQELKRVLDIARNCHVEIILKDISTVRYQPQRVSDWAAMAMELAEQYAK